MSSEWPLIKLNELCLKITDGAHQSPKSVTTGKPMASVKDLTRFGVDLSNARLISEEDFTVLAKQGCKPEVGDVLIAKDGNSALDTVCSVDADLDAVLLSSVAILRPDKSKILTSYLKHYLSSVDVIDYLKSNFISGAAIPRVVLKDFKKADIRVPSLREQETIASVLEAFDSRIKVLRETNATLEAIAQALFKSWFVDFDPVRAKAEGHEPEGMDTTTAALFPDSFEESELGLVPKGWVAATMADISTVGIGKTPPRKEQQWFSEDLRDVRWVSIRDMGASGVYASQTNEYLTPEAVEKFNVRRVPGNTVLMSFKMTIGRVAITDGEMTTNEAIAHFRLDTSSQLSSEYIYLHLRQFDFSRLSSTSSIADAVNSKTVREIPILLPDVQITAAFQDQISTIFSRLKNNEKQARTLTQLRDTLLPRLISGQLRLPGAEQTVGEALA